MAWQKVSTEPTRTGLMKVTFTGRADPDSKVNVDFEGIVWVNPDKSMPTLLSDFLRRKEAAVTIRSCPAHVQPDKKSQIKGKISKGRAVGARAFNAEWVRVTSKGQRLFLPASCVAFGPGLGPVKSNAVVDKKGEFSITLELPPGVLQIPVELYVGGTETSFLATVEVEAVTEKKFTSDEAVVKNELEVSQPQMPKDSFSISLIGGYKSHSIDQTDNSSQFEVGESSPMFGIQFALNREAWSLRFGYRQSSADSSVTSPVNVGARLLEWTASNLTYLSKVKVGDWGLIAGVDYVSAPFYDAITPAIDIEKLTTMLLILGSRYSIERGPAWSQSINLELLGPVIQKSSQYKENGFSGYGARAEYEALYQWSGGFHLGGNVGAKYLNESLYSAERKVLEMYGEALMGLDF